VACFEVSRTQARPSEAPHERLKIISDLVVWLYHTMLDLSSKTHTLEG
jgi:hypothetical protein